MSLPENGTVYWTCGYCHVSGTITDVPMKTSGKEVANVARAEHAKQSDVCSLIHGTLGLHFTFSFDEVTDAGTE